MAVKITRFINGREVVVDLKDATKPIPMSDAERLKRYTGERVRAEDEKKDNPTTR